MKYAFGGILAFVFVVAAIGFGVQGTDFFMYKVFAPKYEQVRYDTFKESQAFNDGMAQQLDKAMVEYAREKDPDAKAAIGSIISHQFAGYDRSRMTLAEQAFLNQIGGVK